MSPKAYKRWEELCPFAILLLFIGSIFWINFHSHLWYGTDMYTYAYEGYLMHQAKSCFPEGWLFGNQYHIISSPNLSALIYGLFDNCVLSMAVTSSISTVLLLLSFLWCFKPFLSRKGLVVGMLCIGGGIIFGTSASSYISGLQVLYTMTSYYSSYLFGLLISLGCWLRIKEGVKLSWPVVLFAIALNVALGMQSLRQILIFNIPLLLIEGFFFISVFFLRKGCKDIHTNRKSFYFALALLLAEILGVLLIKSMNVPACPIIEQPHLDLIPSHLIANFWASTKNLLRISGLAIAMDGMKYLPLSVCALFVAGIVIASIFLIIKTKDDSALSAAILFSLFSVLCVFGVGIFFMRTRDIYYFTYWILAALCIVYFLEHVPIKLQSPYIACILAICLVNYCFTFIPDFKDYHQNGKKLSDFTESLVARDIKVIYVDATPVIAAASKDRIVSQSFWLDVNCSGGYPLTVFPSDKHVAIFDDSHYDGALICFTDYSLGYIESDEAETYRDLLMDKLEFYDQLILGKRRFVLYKPINGERIIEPL